jgi:NhaA family Na+:H+ antiporter
LEIRREIHEGELAELRRAALPVVAALGGMLFPALIYLAFNRSPETQNGWGVPTATDIAFAVGVLALLGKRVPPALRVLLLALAIIDDIGAIIVIAIFYSSGVSGIGFLIAALGVLAVLLLQRFGVRNPLIYVVPGVILWSGMLKSGVHPTIAGVVLGLLTPVKAWLGHESAAPVVRLQEALHGWVAYLIMPLFALANAGVSLNGVSIEDPNLMHVASGVALGLVLGKPLGIVCVSALFVRLGVCALPRGVNWLGVSVVGVVAGIGFTMAIFIAGLAFQTPQQLAAAKLAILVGSAAAATFGLIFGRIVLPIAHEVGAATSLHEAEASTER